MDHEKAEEFCEEDEEFTNRIQDQFLAEEKTDIVGPPLKVTTGSRISSLPRRRQTLWGLHSKSPQSHQRGNRCCEEGDSRVENLGGPSGDLLGTLVDLLVILVVLLGILVDLLGIFGDPGGSCGDLGGSFGDLGGSFRDLGGSFRDLAGSFGDLWGSWWIFW